MPLWGWGSLDHERVLSPAAEAMIEDRLGSLSSPTEPTPISQFTLPESRLFDSDQAQIVAIVGADNCDSSVQSRLLRSIGKSYPDLLRMRFGEPSGVCDLVVSPEDNETLLTLLRFCSDQRIAVVPFGGGTSVVGGVSPDGEGFNGVICVDLAGFCSVGLVDPDSLKATLGAGLTAPAAEAALNQAGLTLGHFPQSYEYATIGGFAATRSSGQASTGYGRFDSNVLGLELVAPKGVLSSLDSPGTAAGPDLRQVAIGSEGAFGLITRLDLQVARMPERTLDRAWVVVDFETGCQLLKELEQDGCAPAVSRLSDTAETAVSLGMAAASRGGRLIGRYARRRAGSEVCILITGFEGTAERTEADFARASAILRRGGAVSLGSAPGKAWRKGRFHGPYLRDVLMARGLLVDTLETSTDWGNLNHLYGSVRDAIAANLSEYGGSPVVMCHVSHLYRTGASLYFTFIGNQPGTDVKGSVAAWQKVKDAACDAIIDAGGTITHHHAVGTDHRPWMVDEVGSLGVSVLAAIKRELDPAGIMNPGKLINRPA